MIKSKLKSCNNYRQKAEQNPGCYRVSLKKENPSGWKILRARPAFAKSFGGRGKNLIFPLIIKLLLFLYPKK